MTPPNLSELRRLAEAATPVLASDKPLSDAQMDIVHAYRRALSPPNVIALLDDNERLRREHAADLAHLQRLTDSIEDWVVIERERDSLRYTLASVISAKYEACRIADSLARVLALDVKKPETVERISHLATIGHSSGEE